MPHRDLRPIPVIPLLPGLPGTALALRRPVRVAATALGLALAALPAMAQPGGPVGHHMIAPFPTISTQGEGQASVAPDMATVSLGVTTQAPTAAQAMSDNAARQAEVIAALKAEGIEPKDLQTQGLNLSPMQDYSKEGAPPVITGYQAQNMVMVRVRDLARLGPLLDAMVAAGATDVQGISFTREDDAAARDEARTKAVADARRRAEVMAAAAGMSLGRLLSLSESGSQGGPIPAMMMAREAKAGSATPVEAGELQLSAQVNGVWALIPGDTSEAPGTAPAAPETPDAAPADPAAAAGSPDAQQQN